MLECDTRFTVSSIFLHACISRIEAEETGETDGYIFNRLNGENVETVFKEKKYWLKGENEPGYLDNYEKCLERERSGR